jgi:ankyrin repeat protein
MYEAALAGELCVCRFIWEHGARGTIRTKSNGGFTPMFVACGGGHLDVLFEAGAAADICTKNNHGQTPMFVACLEGHLDVAQWLFEVGAAADIRTKNNYGHTPMLSACCGGHLDVAQWLLLEGVANGDDCRVDSTILNNNVPLKTPTVSSRLSPGLGHCTRHFCVHRASRDDALSSLAATRA